MSEPDHNAQYDADYYLRGKESGKSLYSNYRWMPNLTGKMVDAIVYHLGILQSDTILDFGCARGYVVRALRELGYSAWGYDVSEWAVENADEKVRDYLIRYEGIVMRTDFDWVIAKDVLEHVPQVVGTISSLMNITNKGLFVVVPLSAVDTESYVVEDYEKDVTHIHRLTLATWVRYFTRPGWRVECSYRLPGVKDNYAKWEAGNGFITCRRTRGKYTNQLR